MVRHHRRSSRGVPRARVDTKRKVPKASGQDSTNELPAAAVEEAAGAVDGEGAASASGEAAVADDGGGVLREMAMLEGEEAAQADECSDRVSEAPTVTTIKTGDSIQSRTQAA